MHRSDVVVVIGAGGIGQTIARRPGTGRAVLLADLNDKTLATAAETLEPACHVIETRRRAGTGLHRGHEAVRTA